jgi:mono/diheme cytochrome c family protein
VSDPDAMNLLQVILHGSKIKTRTKAASMPASSGSLSGADIAAVSNYELQHFRGQQATVTPERIARVLKEGDGH